MAGLFCSRRGTEFAEAAFTAPIVVLLLVAVVNLGVAVYAGQMAEEAARHGARAGAVAQDDPAGMATSAAMSFATSTFATGQPQVQILAPGGVVGSVLKVRVTYSVPNIFGGLGSAFGIPGGPWIVYGEATAKWEGWQ